MIVPLEASDRDWVLRVWKQHTRILGAGPLVWHRSWSQPSTRERWLGVREVAFAHARVRRDGVTVLYEIAVDRAASRQGYGRQLIAALGFPMELKTDVGGPANDFYRALGFALVGQKAGKRKVFNIYRRL